MYDISTFCLSIVATSNDKTTLNDKNDKKISLRVESTTLNDTNIAFMVDSLNF